MNGDYWTFILSMLALTVSVVQFCKVTVPTLREIHQHRQQSRREWDGYAPPWWMCWTYWIGIERWFFGRRMIPNDQRWAA